MGLCLYQVISEEPNGDRKKRRRISTESYRFVNDRHIEERQNINEAEEEQHEEMSSAARLPIIPLPSEALSSQDEYRLLRQRLRLLTRREQQQENPTAGSSQQVEPARSRPMRRWRHERTLDDVLESVHNGIEDDELRHNRASGRLMRIPSIPTVSASRSRLRREFLRNRRRPMRNANSQFILHDIGGIEEPDIARVHTDSTDTLSVFSPMNNMEDDSDGSEDDDGDLPRWEDPPYAETFSERIHRRWLIIQNIRREIRETRRSTGSEEGGGGRESSNDYRDAINDIPDHEVFLRLYGSINNKYDYWKPREYKDVGKVGEDCFRMSRSTRNKLLEASTEKFGRPLPTGVIFTQEDDEST
ncbi:hypothetical protein FOA43_002747 [Brettanomyces nanus]|uniref:Uncharacterized protein n=1 Tax=Eeniella nana TaxID=13502 RepID=A0A875S3B4_EENNA|nr:uncharacterized protein FOA43_002747 [Brettanomyces nanus]QPG75393.1 hypothetical protein FOA43_002747 [Brettanomyces nanus]